jgi:hypothetical protein
VIITSGFLQPEFPIPYPVVYKPYDYSELEVLIRETLADVRVEEPQNGSGGRGT